MVCNSLFGAYGLWLMAYGLLEALEVLEALEALESKSLKPLAMSH